MSSPLVVEAPPPTPYGAADVPAAAPRRPTRRARVLAAVAIGLLSGVFCGLCLARPGFDSDFAPIYNGTRLLLDGVVPYGFMQYNGRPVFGGGWLYYPLPMLWLTSLVAWLPLPVAGGVLFGVGSALVAYAVTREEWWRLHLFASAPFVVAASIGQLSPWLFLPVVASWAGVFCTLKPSVGLAAFAARPSWRTVVACLVVGVATLVAVPSWVRLWLIGVGSSPQHVIPLVAVPGGVLLALAALRWRTPGARLLLALACIPQNPFWYDQLLLFAIPRSRQESIALTAFTQVGFAAFMVTAFASGEPYQLVARPFVMGFCYIPALFLVLRHPLRDGQPGWLVSLRGLGEKLRSRPLGRPRAPTH
jgi:hypothetical protein